jgi:hypothetical protein
VGYSRFAIFANPFGLKTLDHKPSSPFSGIILYIHLRKETMSHAFVKEEDDQWLHDIPGTMPALINYLTRENNGIRVYEKRMTIKNGIEVYEMSNGLSYSKDANGKWQIDG